MNRTQRCPRWIALSSALALGLGCSAQQPEARPASEPVPAAGAKPASGAKPAAAAEPAPEVTRAPSELGPNALPNSPLADLSVTLADGSTSTLQAQLANGKALVVAYTSLNCPVSRLYAPAWEALRQAWAKRGVGLLIVNPMSVDSDADVLENARSLGWSGPVARDPHGALTQALDARRTADVFLLDANLKVRYRGARDDQYGIGYRLPEPRRRYLDDALAALLKGHPIERPATEAPG